MKLLPRFITRRLLRALRPGREPDFVIGGQDRPYIRRWWLIPHNDVFNIYLHQTLRDDDDRALHDHPWVNLSLILDGGYVEVLPDGRGCLIRKWRGPGSMTLRRPTARHRLELPQLDGYFQPDRELMSLSPTYMPRDASPCSWSLFITGPRVREWGFYCAKGWINWRDFVNEADGGATVGRGCDAPASIPGTAERIG